MEAVARVPDACGVVAKPYAPFVGSFSRLLVLVLSGIAMFPVWAQRESSDLATDWKFIKRDVALESPTDAWDSVTIPHTWNNLDGQDGKKAEPQFKDGYYRGPGWYARSVQVLPEWKNKRVFVRFEAASTVAQVYCNGHLLGVHRGSFTAFCFELTRYLRFDGPNELRVRVDNSQFDDVPPLSGDFDVMGGIYRPVHLIVTDPVCISPLDYASPGVYLTTKSVAKDSAWVDVRTVLSSSLTDKAREQLTVELDDANGKFLQSVGEFFYVNPGTMSPPSLSLNIAHPHLWNGRLDPYLYRVVVRVSGNGSHGDEVTQPLGLRTVAITNEEGFLLNGQPYPIHGVNRHQDRRDKGWAMSNADHDEDLKLMLDMGVTAIRLAHYPQSEYVHDLCDRNGILLWNEVSLVNVLKDTPEFKANASQQLHEMILQRCNHPSAAFWGMFNELEKKADPIAVPMIGALKAEAKQLDPSRLNVAASCVFGVGFDTVPDWVCYNPYPGWYNGMPADLTRYIDDRYRENGNKRIGISEYGAGANPFQHQEEPLTKPQPFGPFHPEEWQASVHEQDWAQIKNNPKLWGSFIWCMFDFASDHREEGGTQGVNDKGMVSEDRKVKKDAYFFYQANWTSAPMLHIAGSRLVNRTNPSVDVKVYSNCPRVELTVNGKSLGPVVPDDCCTFRWEKVQLQPGHNVVEADAIHEQLTDTCTWNETAPPPGVK
jgi:beta-galactosidase